MNAQDVVAIGIAGVALAGLAVYYVRRGKGKTGPCGCPGCPASKRGPGEAEPEPGAGGRKSPDQCKFVPPRK